jgi:hypothetical protein
MASADGDETSAAKPHTPNQPASKAKPAMETVPLPTGICQTLGRAELLLSLPLSLAAKAAQQRRPTGIISPASVLEWELRFVVKLPGLVCLVLAEFIAGRFPVSYCNSASNSSSAGGVCASRQMVSKSWSTSALGIGPASASAATL